MEQLKPFLSEDAYLFSWRAAEIPRQDHEVACHDLTINPSARAVVLQHKHRQSLKKAEVAEKARKDLLEENFISEAQYSTWLSNIVLVKKSNGK